MKKYILILFSSVILIGCANFKVEENPNKIKSGHTTISTDRIELKKAVPFDLTTLYMRLFNLKGINEDKYVLGFYYFGKKRADFEKINLFVENERFELLPRIPAEVEDFGAMGVSEELYIKIPNEVLSKIVGSELVELDVVGKGFRYKKVLDKGDKNNIGKFLNHRIKLAYKN